MATLLRMMILVTVFFCAGKSHVSADVSLDDIKARLSSLEDSRQTMQDSLRGVEQEHEQDMDDMTQFCQDLKDSVEEQKEALENIQQSLGEEGQQGNDQSGPCHPDNYTTIDDIRRKIGEVYNGNDHLCDSDLQPGWYRFLLEGENAIIPTTCVPENQCHTHAPTWVDLQGQSPPAVGQQVHARACSAWVGDCCSWEVPITVLNCGDYFVYDIQSLRGCEMAYCAKLN